MAKELTAENIHKDISDLVHGGLNYIEAVAEYANRNDVELELLADIIRRSVILKAKLKEDAERLNMIEKEPSQGLF